MPAPRAIDPRSGFEIPHSELVKEYHGNLVARRFADKPHPRDYPVKVVERVALPNAAPEPPEIAMAAPLLWEDGTTPIVMENGNAILGAGQIVEL